MKNECSIVNTTVRSVLWQSGIKGMQFEKVRHKYSIFISW